MSEVQPNPQTESRETQFYQEVADHLSQQLQAGTAPWQQPWAPGELELPYNPASGHAFKGINAINLLAQGHDDPRWLTAKQADKMDVHLREGEDSVTVQFWKFEERRPQLDEQGQVMRDEQGKRIMETVKLERPEVFYAAVFNAAQFENMPERELRSLDPERHERAETILAHTAAQVLEAPGAQAGYEPEVDAIHLPPRDLIDEPDTYYRHALREVARASGHESRLDREMQAPLGSEADAKEALRSQLASLMIGGQLGIGHDPGEPGVYTHRWTQMLEQAPEELFHAATDAQQMTGYVMGLEAEPEVVQARSVAPEGLASPEQAREALLALLPDVKMPDRFRVSGDLHLAEASDVVITTDHKSAAIVAQDAGIPAVASATIASLPETVQAVQAVFPEKQVYVLNNFMPTHEEAISAALELDHTKGITPAFSDAEREAGARHIHDFYQLRDDPAQAVADCIHRGMEAERGTERVAEPAAEPPERAPEAAVTQREDRDREDQALRDRVEALTGSREAALYLPVGVPRPQEMLITVDPEDAKVVAQSKPVGVVAAYADERLPAVAQAVRELYPEQALVILGHFGQESTVEYELEAAQRAGTEQIYYPKLSAEQVDAGYTHLHHYAQCVDDPQTAVRETIEGALDGRRQGEGLAADQAPAAEVSTAKTYLHVPYEERQEARKLGAWWDTQARSWYAPPGKDLAAFEKWREPQEPPKAIPDPHIAFGQAIRDMGLVLDGQPIMDGQTHKLDVEGTQPGSHKGEYIGYLDGRPAGRIFNFRTNESKNWKAEHYQPLSPEQKAEIMAQTEAKREQYQQERQEGFDRAAKDCQRIWRDCEPIQRDEVHPYLAAKGIGAHGVKAAPESGRLVVPLRNADDVIKSLQFVDKESKQFQKGAQTKGHFHVIGQRPPGDPILIAEGYSTAASIHEATGRAVVCAFNAGNLKPVAEVLREREPGVEMVICADNDHHLGQGSANIGLTKAQEAAQAVGGKVFYPQFTKEELEQGQQFKDFNDLHRSRGLETVRRQVESRFMRMEQAASKEREKEQEQVKEQERKGPEKAPGLSR